VAELGKLGRAARWIVAISAAVARQRHGLGAYRAAQP